MLRRRPVGETCPEDVALYLSTLLWQDAETWGVLSEAPQRQVQPASA
jgi:hypothetical protein